jgi:hypothetical protein
MGFGWCDQALLVGFACPGQKPAIDPTSAHDFTMLRIARLAIENLCCENQFYRTRERQRTEPMPSGIISPESIRETQRGF